MSGGGYDIADYRGFDPVFGALAGAGLLIRDAHSRGIKIIIDIVPNHGSDQHPWFRAALAAAPGSAQRDRFWFRPGTGPRAGLPPHHRPSIVGGPARAPGPAPPAPPPP